MSYFTAKLPRNFSVFRVFLAVLRRILGIDFGVFEGDLELFLSGFG